MIGAWGLLAFIKAGDTRQNASFAVRLVKKAKFVRDDDDDYEEDFDYELNFPSCLCFGPADVGSHRRHGLLSI